MGHPDGDSYCHDLAVAYAQGARKAGHDVEMVQLPKLNFDPVLHKGYKERQVLEPDLAKAQELIKWCQHLVLVYPTWWGTLPSLTKGFIDRTFLPGFAFNSKKGRKLPVQHLKGRSARVVTTMDSPYWFYWLWIGRPGFKMVKRSVLGFCGFSPVRFTAFSNIRFLGKNKLDRNIEKARSLGAKAR